MPSAISSRSRLSSAQARLSNAGSKEVKDAKESKTGGDSAWVEPPLEQAKPSYEDHGGAPYGVLEDMLPLGQAPNARVKSRVRAEASGAKKMTGKNAAGGLASDTQDTPEMTPAFDEPLASSLDAAALQDQPLIIIDDDKDQDYTPRQSKKPAKPRLSRSSLARTVASSPAPTPTSSTSTPVPAPVPAPASASVSAAPAEQSLPSTIASPAPASNGHPAASTLKRAPSRSEESPEVGSTTVTTPITNLEMIVEAADRRSIDLNNPLLGLAIRDTYQRALNDQHLMNVFSAILTQTSTKENDAEFRHHLAIAKKRIKARDNPDKKARKHSTRKNGTRPASSSRKSVAAPELVPRQSIEAPVQPKPKISLRFGTQKKPVIAAETPSTADHAMALPEPRHRSGSVSSSSSLSSLTSLEEDAMDVDSADEAITPAQPLAQSASLPTMNANLQVNGSIAGQHTLKRTSAEVEIDEREQALAAKKQKYSETINRDEINQTSHMRIMPSRHSGVNNNALIPPVRLTPNGNTGHNNLPRRGSVDMGSPLTDMSSPPPSRRGTPRTLDGPARTIKKKAKTKQSPIKKPTAVEGDETNGSGGRASPAGYDDNEESDNNDFCSSCRGSGFLLCCDGCDRSFHFACLDPPLSQNASELEEPWFCFKCISRRAHPQRQHRGLFSALLANLDKRNPTIFSLPSDVREYLEGVSTGKDGRFIEAANGKTRSRAGYDELPDNYKVKDSKGQVITCYHCSLSSMGRREIITCDMCNAHWHLDCLDPPLANAPFRDQWGKKVRDWLCPLHVDHELREMDMSRLAGRQLERDRKVFMRRPRNAKVVDANLNRGFINNGIIEVVNDESEGESEFYEEEVTGVVYRLPEKGIKLDFIDRVKQTKYAPAVVVSRAAAKNISREKEGHPLGLGQPEFVKRSFPEQQTALSLLQFATSDSGMEISSDQMENLIGTLIAEAPADVVAKMLTGEKNTITADGAAETAQKTELERKNLEMLQALITKKLAALSKELTPATSD